MATSQRPPTFASSCRMYLREDKIVLNPVRSSHVRSEPPVAASCSRNYNGPQIIGVSCVQFESRLLLPSPLGLHFISHLPPRPVRPSSSRVKPELPARRSAAPAQSVELCRSPYHSVSLQKAGRRRSLASDDRPRATIRARSPQTAYKRQPTAVEAGAE